MSMGGMKLDFLLLLKSEGDDGESGGGTGRQSGKRNRAGSNNLFFSTVLTED